MDNNSTFSSKEYHNKYYNDHKEELNHTRLAYYHRKKNNIPIDKIDIYLKNRCIYNSIIKNKNDLNLEFIKFIFNEL